jgi:hypothetical protein
VVGLLLITILTIKAMELRSLLKKIMILIAKGLIGWAPVYMMGFGLDIPRLIIVITMAMGITIMRVIGTIMTAIGTVSTVTKVATMVEATMAAMAAAGTTKSIALRICFAGT